MSDTFDPKQLAVIYKFRTPNEPSCYMCEIFNYDNMFHYSVISVITDNSVEDTFYKSGLYVVDNTKYLYSTVIDDYNVIFTNKEISLTEEQKKLFSKNKFMVISEIFESMMQ